MQKHRHEGTDEWTVIQAKAHKHADSKTNRKMVKELRQTHILNTQNDIHTDTQADTHRQTDTHRDRQTGRKKHRGKDTQTDEHTNTRRKNLTLASGHVPNASGMR